MAPRTKPRTPKLKKTLTPGQVVIVLSGPFAGKRVVFLKQLKPSGLLLVTGPYKLNGVPLRRMCQTRIIATSTKVDVSKCGVEGVDDKLFLMSKEEKNKSVSERKAFIEQGTKPTHVVNAKRVEMQKKCDEAIQQSIGKDRMMKMYLKSTFSLTGNPPPHLLKW
eukprot:GHVN01049480.1.p1 GENE.GHVN01049480.1~~GHVN01049480.1.p1  ORF type:complete len:164 (+),score=34.62 GHVN01049480.1:160-651(+)